jgi:hypothetical protein
MKTLAESVSPAVARPLNRALASAIGAVSSVFASLRYASEAVEAWLDERSEVFDARADVNDPDLVDELEEDDE